jgi:hypothetical protein
MSDAHYPTAVRPDPWNLRLIGRPSRTGFGMCFGFKAEQMIQSNDYPEDCLTGSVANLGGGSDRWKVDAHHHCRPVQDHRHQRRAVWRRLVDSHDCARLEQPCRFRPSGTDVGPRQALRRAQFSDPDLSGSVRLPQVGGSELHRLLLIALCHQPRELFLRQRPRRTYRTKSRSAPTIWFSTANGHGGLSPSDFEVVYHIESWRASPLQVPPRGRGE